MKKRGILAATAVLLLVAGTARAIYLTGTEHLDVTIPYFTNAQLTDSSSISILPGGSVYDLSSYHHATAYVSGGNVGVGNGALAAYDNSTVYVTGGSVTYIVCYDNSALYVSEGNLPELISYRTSTMDLSGGNIAQLLAYNYSTITIHGYDFQLGDGLTMDGDTVRGCGGLWGKWLDGTAWSMGIQDYGATILVVPEPATLSLLALGGLALLRRRLRRA
jgi:hypothetical protein